MHGLDEMEFGLGGEEMAHDLVVGDNIIVMCQTSRDESFWIMLIDQPMCMVIEHFMDTWGQEWFEGDYVIHGLWYETLCLGSRSYYLLE